MLLAIDGYLLDKIQKFCDKQQQVTGITKFGFSRFLLTGVTIFYFLGAVANFFLESIPNSIACMFIVFMYSMVIWEITRGEKRFHQHGTLLEPIWTYAAYVPLMRLVLITIPFGDVILVIFYGSSPVHPFFDSLLPLSSYVIACTPRPPSKSKMREVYEKGLAWLGRKLDGPKTSPAPSS